MSPWLNGLLFAELNPSPSTKRTLWYFKFISLWHFSDLFYLIFYINQSLLVGPVTDPTMSVFTLRQKVTYACAVTWHLLKNSAELCCSMMPRPLKQFLCEPCITLSPGFVWRGWDVWILLYVEMVLEHFNIRLNWALFVSEVFLYLLSLQNGQWSKLIAQCSECSLICSPKHLSQLDLHLVQTAERNDRKGPRRQGEIRLDHWRSTLGAL